MEWLRLHEIATAIALPRLMPLLTVFDLALMFLLLFMFDRKFYRMPNKSPDLTADSAFSSATRLTRLGRR